MAQRVKRRPVPPPEKVHRQDAAAEAKGQGPGEAQVAGAVVAAAAGLQDVVAQSGDPALAKPVEHPGAQGAVALFRIAIFRLFADEALPLAGNIAYRTLLSTFPFSHLARRSAPCSAMPGWPSGRSSSCCRVAPSYVVEPIQREIHDVLVDPAARLVPRSRC